jgi:hypothetical protein
MATADTLDDETVYVLAEGYRWGYPECCIAQFATDWTVGLPSGRLRGGTITASGGLYVPCWSCIQPRVNRQSTAG